MDAGADSGILDAGSNRDAGAADSGFVDAGLQPDAGRCAASTKNPPNVLENPGFECMAVPNQWSGAFTLVTDAFAGTTAAKLTADQNGAGLIGINLVAQPAVDTDYCITIHAKGTAPSVRIAGLSTPSAIRFTNPLATTSWVRAPPSSVVKVPVLAGHSLALSIDFPTGTAMPGDTILLDDVDVWASSSNCTETR